MDAMDQDLVEAERLEALLAEREALDREIARAQERIGAAGEAGDDVPTRFRLHCVEVRPLRAMWSLLNYADLRETLFDGRRPHVAGLYFTHVFVVVQGGNLATIVAGLRMHTQWVIEEHDERKDGPPPPGKPFVSFMEFIRRDMADAVAVFSRGGSLKKWGIDEKRD